MKNIQIEIERLWSEVTTLATISALLLPSLPNLTPFTIDLFVDEEPPQASDKFPHVEDSIESEAEARAIKKEKRHIEKALRASRLDVMVRQERERQRSVGALISRDIIDSVPSVDTNTHANKPVPHRWTRHPLCSTSAHRRHSFVLTLCIYFQYSAVGTMHDFSREVG